MRPCYMFYGINALLMLEHLLRWWHSMSNMSLKLCFCSIFSGNSIAHFRIYILLWSKWLQLAQRGRKRTTNSTPAAFIVGCLCAHSACYCFAWDVFSRIWANDSYGKHKGIGVSMCHFVIVSYMVFVVNGRLVILNTADANTIWSKPEMNHVLFMFNSGYSIGTTALIVALHQSIQNVICGFIRFSGCFVLWAICICYECDFA